MAHYVTVYQKSKVIGNKVFKTRPTAEQVAQFEDELRATHNVTTLWHRVESEAALKQASKHKAQQQRTENQKAYDEAIIKSITRQFGALTADGKAELLTKIQHLF